MYDATRCFSWKHFKIGAFQSEDVSDREPDEKRRVSVSRICCQRKPERKVNIWIEYLVDWRWSSLKWLSYSPADKWTSALCRIKAGSRAAHHINSFASESAALLRTAFRTHRHTPSVGCIAAQTNNNNNNDCWAETSPRRKWLWNNTATPMLRNTSIVSQLG